MRQFLVMLAALYAFPVFPQGESTTIYRTVNEQGVVEFSDSPPPEGVSAQRLDVPHAIPVDTERARANLEAMRETTDRLAADRRARESGPGRSPIVFLEAPAELVPAARQETRLERESLYLPPVYYPRRPQRPWHPRPPFRPDLVPQPDPNRQLMRPITEQRLRDRDREQRRR